MCQKNSNKEEHHQKDTEEDLNQSDAKCPDGDSIDKHERSIPTDQLLEENKKHNIDIKSEDETEFDDQFDLVKDHGRVNETKVSHGKNNYLEINSTDSGISMVTVEVSKVIEGLTSDLEGKQNE